MGSIEKSSAFRANLVGAAHKSLMSSLAHTRGEQIRVMVEDIHVLPGFNPRIDSPKLRAYIRGLANKIKAVGFYDHKPLSVYGQMQGKKPILILHDGHCRLEAVKLAVSEGAEIEDLPVVVKDRSTTEEDLLVGMVNSNEGRPLSALETAIVSKRLVGFGWKKGRIAESIGKTEDYVDKLLILAGAPAEIRAMVESGQISAALATQMVVRHGSDAVAILQKQMQAAVAAGQNKILPRNMPAQVRRRAMTVAAPRMLTVLSEVLQLKGIPTELRATVIALLDEIPTDDSGSSQQLSPGTTAEREFQSRQMPLMH